MGVHRDDCQYGGPGPQHAIGDYSGTCIRGGPENQVTAYPEKSIYPREQTLVPNTCIPL